jgi:hypothetical protein
MGWRVGQASGACGWKQRAWAGTASVADEQGLQEASLVGAALGEAGFNRLAAGPTCIGQVSVLAPQHTNSHAQGTHASLATQTTGGE